MLSFGICFKLTNTARNTNTTDDGAALKAQQYNNRVSGLQALQTLASFYPAEHTHGNTHTPPPPPPPPLPPAYAILPTATLGKIIRWLADILSIFLSWLRVRLAGCLLIDVLTDFYFFIYFFPQELCPGLPDCKRASRGKCTGRREGLTNAKQFIKIRHKASIRGEGCC